MSVRLLPVAEKYPESLTTSILETKQLQDVSKRCFGLSRSHLHWAEMQVPRVPPWGDMEHVTSTRIARERDNNDSFQRTTRKNFEAPCSKR